MKNKLWWKAFGISFGSLLLFGASIFLIFAGLLYYDVAPDLMAGFHNVVPMRLVEFMIVAAIVTAGMVTSIAIIDGDYALQNMIWTYQKSLMYWNIFGLVYAILYMLCWRRVLVPVGSFAGKKIIMLIMLGASKD